jgi:O-antigen ligase
MTAARTGAIPHPAGARAKPAGAAPEAIVGEVSKLASMLVAGVVFVNITRVASLYGFLEAAEIPLLMTALAAVVMFAQARKWRPGDIGKHWIPKLIAVVLVFAIAGIPWSIHRNASFTFLTHGYSQSLLGGLLVFGVARTPKGRRLMAQTLVVSGIVTAWLALLWSRRDNAGRLAGAATYDSNDLALIVVITMPLLIWWFFDNKSKIRWLAILALPLLFTVMLRTSSRGGFLGMVAILAGLLFIGTTGRVREVRRIALTGILLAGLGAVALPGAYLERMRTMDEEIDNDSPRARINVWKRGVGYALDNPILGVGIANFGRAEGTLSEYSQERGGRGVKWSTAHSSYIEAWAEIGLIGGTAFAIAVLGSTLALMLWKPPPWMRDPAQRMLTPMMGLSLGAFTVSGAFLSFAFASPPYYLLGFATALLLSSRIAPPDAVAPRGPGGAVPRQPPRPPAGWVPPRGGLSRYPAPPSPHMPPPRGAISRYPAPPPRTPPPRGPRA